MKDNTAAVHVQVPVEVTSFLLNEKRTEITKIELKQRVTVLLVPNKHLETPNYKLERLRHDDPRLENLQASYTMIEEPDDEVAITRREKAKPKQEPVIKGVLPDQPAPTVPTPARAAAAARLSEPAPTTAAKAAAPQPTAPVAASGGFVAWLKKLFGGNATPASAAPAAVASASLSAAGGDDRRPAREGREGRDGRGRGDRRGGRGRDGGRGSERPGERAGEARGGPRGDDQRRRGRDGRADRQDTGEAVLTAEDRSARPESRGGQEGSRRGQRPGREGPAGVETPVSTGTAAQTFVDTIPVPEPATAAEGGDTERDGRRRRRRGGRGGRGGRDEGSTEPTTQLIGDTDAARVEPRSIEAEPGHDAGLPADTAAPADDSRRRRDRPRREPREADATRTPLHEASVEPAPFHRVGIEVPMHAEREAMMPEAESASSPSLMPNAPPQVALPPFELPLEQLQEIADGAGLQWVNSDADKIRAVQEAIAAVPKPVHVPRERKPIVMPDDGPLVLVETRKDLSQLKLPFEVLAAQAQQQQQQ